ncbi:beta-microseminoprotein-like precursor [Danio rerio]|uniref:Prostate-associated microseminoprotein n=1 Tax=Danio rerio TaxID=7955 RepID=A0AB13A7F1_DANRE|nr:beta-microseminoprotein-like precursor [Danio rerio]|eukprot:XP_003199194.1 beta-microseminoprotein-like [Danio rerio]
MASLTLVLILCAFVSLSDSYCFLKLQKEGAKYCEDGDDQTRHELGSTWINSKCLRCICSSTEMECCDTMGRAIIKTEGCTVKYDYSTCKFDVFHPEDPNIKCEYGAVGK